MSDPVLPSKDRVNALIAEVEAVMAGEHGSDWADHFGPLFGLIEAAKQPDETPVPPVCWGLADEYLRKHSLPNNAERAAIRRFAGWVDTGRRTPTTGSSVVPGCTCVARWVLHEKTCALMASHPINSGAPDVPSLFAASSPTARVHHHGAHTETCVFNNGGPYRDANCPECRREDAAYGVETLTRTTEGNKS